MSNITKLTIKQLLSEDSYRIPIYQRNYDWSEKQVLQLVEDIADYAIGSAASLNHNYYLGTIVVYPRTEGSKTYYETVDGQQRLMTLTILLNVLKQKNVKDKNNWKWYHRPNLEFEHRDRDNEAIRLMDEGKLMDAYENTTNIRALYRMIEKAVDRLTKCEKFLEFFLEKVLVIRVPIPKGTNLNHYFEIMNSRGEQLEKHEILKANLMNMLNKNNDENNNDERWLFNEIWEACSNMNKYVQMNLRVKLREIIFTESWDAYQDNDFDKLLSLINEQEKAQEKAEKQSENQSEDPGPTERSIMQLFDDAQKHVDYPLPNDEDDQKGDGQERFGSVIGFPNFLLHVLKIMYHNETNKDTGVDNEIKLDDKRLIEIFDTVIDSKKDKSERYEFAKKFIIALLKLRYLFDRYIIKREHVNNRENWSVKRLNKSNSNANYDNTFSDVNNTEDGHSKEIRMLEAMFHVSAPTQIYKNWLNATLNYVYTNNQINAESLHDMLYQLACTYMLDRYLCYEPVEFETIIYNNRCKAQNHIILWENIDRGCSVENFVFNFYDYIIWKEGSNNYQDFEFTYRTSVEHFYPQHPMEGNQPLIKDVLDMFGNLCLISNSMNSKFNNNMPKAKVANFANDKSVKTLSIKLLEMMKKTDNGQWGEKEIKDFGSKAKEKFLKLLREAEPDVVVAGLIAVEASAVGSKEPERLCGPLRGV